jgi:hypothetical protein
MKGRLLKAPSPAMTVACIALAVALSGAGYAAVTLPRNSVGTPQLKKNAVVSAKVKDRSLRANDFALGQLPAGPAGAPGPQGPAGPRGSSVVARIGNALPITTSGNAESNWPLVNNTWTQATNEINDVFAQASVTTSNCAAGGQVLLLLDGEVAFSAINLSSSPQVYRMSRAFAFRMEPDAAVTHQVTARVSDGCGTAGQDITVDDLRVDVVAHG